MKIGSYTVVGDYFNTLKTTSILIYIKLLNSMDKQKHGKKEKLSIKKVLLDYFVNLLTIKTQIKKSFSLY